MPAKIFGEVKAIAAFDDVLHGVGEVRPGGGRRDRGDTCGEGIFAGAGEFEDDGINGWKEVRPRGITNPTLVADTDIDFQNIAGAEGFGV